MNKFEQVSTDDHQLSLAGGLGLGGGPMSGVGWRGPTFDVGVTSASFMTVRTHQLISW